MVVSGDVSESGMSMVQYNGRSFFLASGESDVGVVLVHQIHGLDDYIKSVSTKLAAAGFSAAAADLQEGMKLREAVTREELLSAFESGMNLRLIAPEQA